MNDIYKNIEGYNQKKKKLQNINTFDDMIADMHSNKKHNLVVTEMLIRRRKLKMSDLFIAQSHFAEPKNFR